MSQIIDDLRKASEEGRIILIGEGKSSCINEMIDYISKHPKLSPKVHNDSIMSYSYILANKEIGDKHEKDSK